MKSRFVILVPVLFLLFNQLHAQSLADRIGVCTSVDKAPLLKNSGCSYLEIGIRSFLVPDKPDSGFASNLVAAGKSVLPLYSGNSFFLGEFRLTGPDVCPDSILAYGEKAMKRAHEIGTRIFVLGSGTARNVPENFSREEAMKQFTLLCRQLAEIASRYQVIVVIEPLRSAETNFINTVREGTALVRSVNHPNLGVLADFYHMLCEQEDPEALVEAGTWLKHCHIAEKENRTAPGVAGDDFTPFFRALNQINYTGRLSIECRWERMEEQIGPAVAEIKRQIQISSNKK